MSPLEIIQPPLLVKSLQLHIGHKRIYIGQDRNHQLAVIVGIRISKDIQEYLGKRQIFPQFPVNLKQQTEESRILLQETDYLLGISESAT
jgi:hypothetical protein